MNPSKLQWLYHTAGGMVGAALTYKMVPLFVSSRAAQLKVTAILILLAYLFGVRQPTPGRVPPALPAEPPKGFDPLRSK